MNVVVTGTKAFNDYEVFKTEMNRVLNMALEAVSENTYESMEYSKVVIVHGDNGGVDDMASKYALDYGISCMPFLPLWTTYGKYAGYIRNEEMAEHADMVVAFWDRASEDVQNMILHAKVRGIPVFIVDICDWIVS